MLYASDIEGFYPANSSLKSETTALGRPRLRWADYLFPFMPTETVCLSPNPTREERELMEAFSLTPWRWVPWSPNVRTSTAATATTTGIWATLGVPPLGVGPTMHGMLAYRPPQQPWQSATPRGR